MTKARWTQLLCVAAGLATAWLVHHSLALKFQVTMPEPVRIAIRTSTSVAVKKAVPVETLPLVGMPKLVDKPRPAASAPAAASAASAVSAPESDEPILSAAPLEIRQLASVTPADEGPPPKPPEDAFVSQYNDAPGRLVAVIAILLNDAGEAIDTKLVIPSRHPLKDLALITAARQQRVTSIQPPLVPGERRWLELRFEYPDPTIQEGLIP